MAAYRPNDASLVKGEVRKLTFKHGAAAGLNVVNSFTVSAQNVSFDTPVVSGTTATVFGTFNTAGTHIITGTAVLASGETLVATVRAHVRDPNCDRTERDYD
ncbi:hypothetical protein [Tsuneonella sp. HG222]